MECAPADGEAPSAESPADRVTALPSGVQPPNEVLRGVVALRSERRPTAEAATIPRWSPTRRRSPETAASRSLCIVWRRSSAGIPPTSATYQPVDYYARQAFDHNHGLSARDSLLISAESLAWTADHGHPENWVSALARRQ